MRIVGGIYKGRTLYEFKGQDIRPTSDKTRESLFNILQFNIQGKTFLDLFCGSGAVGIEALSRGAKRVVFNDLSRESISLTKKNLEKVGAKENFSVTNQEGSVFYKYCTEKFDYVFIDPPYKTELGLSVLQNVASLLTDDGIAIYENEKPFEEDVQGLVITDQRKYGRAHLTFFKKGE